jgi:hypothetical protein
MATAMTGSDSKPSRIDAVATALCTAFLRLFGGSKGPSHEPDLDLPEGAVEAVPPFEQETDGERAALKELQKLTAMSVVTRLTASLETNPIAKALRDQHPKAHGCLRAQFVVDENIPLNLRAGVFQAGAAYDARVRFSNASSPPAPDKKGDGRGMAIKLMGVQGESLLTGEHRDRVGRNTQDFLLTNFPVFFVSTPREYLRFLSILSFPLLKRWLLFFFFFLVRPRKLIIFLRTACNRIDSPLREPYHSLTPYRLGDCVVRYKVTPCGPRGRKGEPRVDKSNPCFLREAIVADLSSGSAEFDFLVQVLRRPTPRLVEDPSRYWSRFESDMVRVARIIIQPQDFNTNSRDYDCERIVFNAWNALSEHRPIGGINRSRFGVYMAVSKTRHNLNMVELSP